MKHSPCDCRHCGQAGGRPPCPKPPKPCAETVLLPRIICREQRRYPCLRAELALDGAPSCAQPPYTLLMVQQSGAPPCWAPLESACDGQLRVRVSIPVCCQVRDACGRLYCLAGVVEVDTGLRPTCPASECWRYALAVVPCVRLREEACATDRATFEACLEVCLDLYLLHPEPFALRRSEPPCPELPLYPPPVTPPRCSAQCQAAPARCGWPKQG